MKTAVFSARNFERPYLTRANGERHELIFLEARLSEPTAALAAGCEAISLFSGDNADGAALAALSRMGVKHLTLRSAGFNNVDLGVAKTLGLQVARVPAYSPYAIAEHTVAMMLALNRKLIQANRRIMELNFSLDGLVGFDMNGKTVGVVGTGKIGSVLVKILHGFGCHVLAYDLEKNDELVEQYGAHYTDLAQLCEQSDILSLQVPLNPQTRYMIDAPTIARMKRGAMLINTSRGGLVNTKAVIDALKTGQIGSFGMDVYEEEEGLFFEDRSEEILQDDVIARLMTFKNVLITSHQAFLTETALENIASTTIQNLDDFQAGQESDNRLV